MTAELEIRRSDLDARFVVTGEAWAYAKALAQAEATPKAFRGSPADVFLVMQAAVALDIPVYAALSGVNVVEGKAEAGAELMLALVRRAGHLARHGGTRTEAWCEITRADDPDYTYRETFDLHDAEQAELCEIVDEARGLVKARSKYDKPLPWQLYTRVMLRWRAISACVSFACPEVLMGVRYVHGEVGGPIDGTALNEAALSVDALPPLDPAATTEPAERAVDEPEPTGEAPVTVDADTSGSDDPERYDLEYWQRWRAELDAAIGGTSLTVDLNRISELGNIARGSGRDELYQLARDSWTVRSKRGAPDPRD